MKHKLKAFTLALLSIFFVFGGKVSAETVNIVSDTAYAPFEFKDSDQTYKGIDVDIVNEVAKRAGWNVNMTYPGFDAAVNAVQSGQADALMAGTTVTEARKKVFNYSDTYYDTSDILYTKNNNKVTNYKQLKGKL
ncbi:transporter substrate-binding domain-containing protein, partial [Streptococcus agalactiae]|nr:transporter substrate-binding domain-containing protein [Streptococcus agalactiae]